MSKKIEVEEHIEIPSFGAPRTMVWVAAICAAPFTAGLSLIGILIFALGARKERQRAADEIAERCSVENDADILTDLVREGVKRASVSSTHDLGHMGLGHVTRKTRFRISESTEQD